MDDGPPDAELIGPPAIVVAAPEEKRICPPSPGGEIVVCAEREEQEQFRLRPLDPRYADLATEDNRLRTTVGNTEIFADTEAATLAGGVTSQRVMVRAKIKF